MLKDVPELETRARAVALASAKVVGSWATQSDHQQLISEAVESLLKQNLPQYVNHLNVSDSYIHSTVQ